MVRLFVLLAVLSFSGTHRDGSRPAGVIAVFKEGLR
jgi:hypothetical protein